MNELRQTKEYGYRAPFGMTHEVEDTKEYKLSDQGGDYTVPHKGAEPKGYKDIAGDPDLIESAKELITNKILKHFDDMLFQMVCKEMDDNYMFQSRNYLTEAGYELFEDEWYEFYHEHRGDILYRVKHGLFE